MKEVTEIKHIGTYALDLNFYIDLSLYHYKNIGPAFDVFLYDKDYCIKTNVFSIPIRELTSDDILCEVLQKVEEILKDGEYIEEYKRSFYPKLSCQETHNCDGLCQHCY